MNLLQGDERELGKTERGDRVVVDLRGDYVLVTAPRGRDDDSGVKHDRLGLVELRGALGLVRVGLGRLDQGVE